MAYDPSKAALYNQLIQQGLSEDAALAQAGIGNDVNDYAVDEVGTPETNPNYGQLVAVRTDSPTADAPVPVPEFVTAPQEVRVVQSPVAGDIPEIDTPEPAEIPEAYDPAVVDDPYQVDTPDPAPIPEEFDPAPVNEFVYDPNTGEMVPGDSVAAEQIRSEDPSVYSPNDTDAEADPAIVNQQAAARAQRQAGVGEEVASPDADTAAAAEQNAAKSRTINQATLQSRYKQQGSSDWRVRLQLAPTSDYLYNAKDADILLPLAATNGVIFPYTPQINTVYKANYELYDLVHSNYRGAYYKNSRVDDIQIRGTFTAQDTNEADYLLAVIHFFRSVTKMFYGKDQERGSPPPLVYLSGFGDYQYNSHPCVVASFQYNLPDKVDYIRARSPNDYGAGLLSRRTPYPPSSMAGLGSTANRLLNSITGSGQPLSSFPGGQPSVPTTGMLSSSVKKLDKATYVPTQMDIDLTLIPVQARSQVSKQFSLREFANGSLLKGGFW